MWELYYKESWVPKNWCFWAVVLEKTLENPLDCKEIQPVLSVHCKDWCWSWNSYTLATWCKGSFEKTLMLGMIEGRKRRGWQRMRWLYGITDSMEMSWVDSRSWWWTGRPGVLWSMGSRRVGYDRATVLNWTEYSLEGLMLKLKLQYFGHLIQRAVSLEKALIFGNFFKAREEGSRRWYG